MTGLCNLPHSILLYFLVPSWLDGSCRAYLADTSLDGVFGVTAGTYVLFFGLTVALEAPLYYVALRKGPIDLGRLAAVIVCINLCTHPLAVLGFPQFFALAGWPKIWAIGAAELFAPAIEGLALWAFVGVPVKRGLVTAFLVNLFSWELGGLTASMLSGI